MSGPSGPRCGLPRAWPGGSPCHRWPVERPRGSLAPADALPRAPVARIQISRIHSTVPCHAPRRLQSRQFPAPADLPPHPSLAAILGARGMARGRRHIEADPVLLCERRGQRETLPGSRSSLNLPGSSGPRPAIAPTSKSSSVAGGPWSSIARKVPSRHLSCRQRVSTSETESQRRLEVPPLLSEPPPEATKDVELLGAPRSRLPDQKVVLRPERSRRGGGGASLQCDGPPAESSRRPLERSATSNRGRVRPHQV